MTRGAALAELTRRIVWRTYYRVTHWLDTVVMLRDFDAPATGRERGADQLAAAEEVNEMTTPDPDPEPQFWPESVVELEDWIKALSAQIGPYYDSGPR